ncbi:MAG TPA: hypothetical protein VF767_07840 [Bryobacteraceae bacterium]
MRHSDGKASLERGAAPDLWRHTLSQIPSLFGRLVYLCSLRDPNDGGYEHYGLAQVFGNAEADRVLRESHHQAFASWVCLTLEQQKTDLDLYLSGLTGDRRTILDTWIRLQPYRNLMPGTAREVERELYMADLDAILGLLKNEYGVASPDPDA